MKSFTTRSGHFQRNYPDPTEHEREFTRWRCGNDLYWFSPQFRGWARECPATV
ncbi:MAG: hypothetical protein OXC31_29425 [Spirochaetaceae bacterium]|nr:hypothetical protein [Spirochaetaceae bacterium]